MRQLQKGKSKKRTRTKSREPLAEGIRKRRPKNFFTRMSEKELVAFAKEFMEENGIGGRRELAKADGGLYDALRGRKLLDKVGLEEKYRQWNKMSDDKLVVFAKKFMKEKGISGRKELEKADSGLYEALRRRKLLNRAFMDIEQARDREAVQQVVDALKEFGGQA